MTIDVDPSMLRRIALERQGLLARTPFGRGRQGALSTVEHLGYVQIDTISVVARAHDHAFWVRVPGYRPEHLARLIARREVFEYWAHAAAFLPMKDYRFALPLMRAFKRGKGGWQRHNDQTLVRRVLERIRSEGPLRARDFDNPDRKRMGWWDWKPAKRALEQLFMQGDVMITARDGFQKTYDLAERVLPANVDSREPSVGEYASHLIDRTLQAHGFATLKSFTYGRRNNPALRASAKREVQRRVHSGELVVASLTTASGRKAPVYALPGAFDVAPRVSRRVHILSPFDNAIIQRHRTLDLFAYDYMLECYTPPKQRKFGYFCLPLLYRDRFVGRIDCKAHRGTGVLEVKHFAIEEAPRDMDAFFAAFADTIRDYARFNGCTEVTVTRSTPRDVLKPLRRALD
jgi:uncharacterized protein YcaQ